MSDQWETVTKSRKSRVPVSDIAVTNSTNGARQPAKNTIRIEDVLSRQQIQSLYAGDSPKKQPTATAAPKKPPSKSSIPAALIPAHKQKSSAPPSRPKPKNLEAGLSSLNLSEVESLVDTYRNNFTDSHLVWLKAIIAHLNLNLNIETNPTFVGHSPRYPANIVPNRLQTLIYQTLRDAGVANIHYFYDQTLSSMADDLTKNLPVTGYKIMLQLIAIEWPTVCVKSLAKNAILRNSYQNRAPIGLTLLWALGQGGFRDVNVGLRVWQNIMLPVVEIKAYTRFVVEYVHRILHNTKSTVEVTVSTEELYRFYDELTLHRQWLAKDLQTLLDESAATLLSKFVQASTKVQPIFITLFKRLNETGGSNIVGALTQCLLKEADCLKAWRIIFRKHASESNVLLHELNKPEYSSFVGSKLYSDFLSEVRTILRSVPEAKITDDLKESNRLLRNSQDKSAQHKSNASKSKGCCTFFLLASFVAFLSIVGVLLYDTHTHGNSFAKSATGQFLERAGALPYVELAWVKTMGPAARGYKLAEQHVPVYAGQAYTTLHPYGLFVRDLGIVAWSTVQRGAAATCDCFHQKAPIVAAFVEQYVPGLPQKISDASVQLWTTVQSTSVQVYASGFEFFKTKVFVGQLSPESLGQALNRTTIAATQLNKWFHGRVEVFSKYE